MGHRFLLCSCLWGMCTFDFPLPHTQHAQTECSAPLHWLYMYEYLTSISLVVHLSNWPNHLSQDINLGTTLYTSLSWHNHFISKTFGWILLLKHILNSPTSAFIATISLFNYLDSCLWGLPTYLLVALHSLFHIAATVIFPEHRFCHVIPCSSPLFSGWSS